MDRRMKTSTLNRSLSGAAFAVAGILALAPAQGQVITNGDFTTDISGWTTQGVFTQWSNFNGPDSLPGCMWLNDVPGPVAYGEQTITGLNPGQTYNISAFYESHVFFFGPGSFTAQVDGTTYFTNPDTAYVSAWTPVSFSFVAATSSATLRFNAQVGNDSDYNVDKVVLSTKGNTAVPEPGSVALLVGMITVGAGVLRKRRK